MLVKALGLIDLIAGLILVIGATKFLPTTIVVIVGVALLAKSSLGMLQDVASWFDFFGGAILLMSAVIFVPWLVQVFVGILVLQKGIFSFF
jgi:hypothetical protein